MKTLFPLLFSILCITACTDDSDDQPDPDSTHVFVVSIDQIATSSNCNSGNGGEAVMDVQIELYISTRQDGTPSRPDEEMDFDPIIIPAGQSRSVDIELETDFAIEDDVLIEARIAASDTEAEFELDEEFWHSSYYTLEDDCWRKSSGLNANCFAGNDSNSELFETSISTSMAGPDCQIFFEWGVWIERI